jgi:choline dehydrogenase-like flavoprotein
MIEDARLLPIHAKLNADIVIIGGGAAGISLALNYVNSSFRVVILEGGGLNYERKTQSLYRGKNVGLRYEPLDLCRVRMFGGSTDRRGWAGWCKVFRELEFEQRDWVQLSGWPISKRGLEPYYRKALTTMALASDIEQSAESEAYGPNCLPLNGSDCVNDPIALSTSPHLSEAWSKTLEASQNVCVILHANVVGIDADEAGQVATAVRFSTLDRREFSITSRFTVIAAGGIENARLMLCSNETVRTGLGNTTGWVGRCFMDHPRYAWGQIAAIPDARLLSRYNPTHGVGQRRFGVPPPGARPLFGFGISLSDAAQRRERLLGSRTWILPVAQQGERAGGRELREVILWATRGRLPADILLRGRKIVGDIPNAAAASVAHIRSIAGRTRHWQFLTIIEPEPNPESRVMLDDDRDQLGLPRVKLDWRLTPLVERTLDMTQRMIIRDLQSIGVQCAIEGAGGKEANQRFEDPRWVWHHMGTTRMSVDPRRGVVDANCKVHGMHNLYLAGSSVFPTCSNDMPTLTLVALSHRLADHLRSRLNMQSAAEMGATIARRRGTSSKRATEAVAISLPSDAATEIYDRSTPSVRAREAEWKPSAETPGAEAAKEGKC